MKKTKTNPETCGTPDHDPMCLCDVKLPNGAGEIKSTIPHSYQYGAEIIQHLDIGYPWTGADLADFLEMVDKIETYKRHPSLWETDKFTGRPLKKMSNEQMDYLKEIIRWGTMPSPAAQEMYDMYGIEISRTYVAKVKARMIERGEM